MGAKCGIDGVSRDTWYIHAQANGAKRTMGLGLCGVGGTMRQFYGRLSRIEISGLSVKVEDMNSWATVYSGKSKSEIAKYSTLTIGSNYIQAQQQYAHRNKYVTLTASEIRAVFKDDYLSADRVKEDLDTLLQRLGWTLSWPVKYGITNPTSGTWSGRGSLWMCGQTVFLASSSQSGTKTLSQSDVLGEPLFKIEAAAETVSSSRYFNYKLDFSSNATVNGSGVPVTVVNDLTA